MINSKSIAFRCDASLEIGSGHVMRCLTLAVYFSSKGHSCFFICRDLPGQMISFILEQGFECFVIGEQKNRNNNTLNYSQLIDAQQTKCFILNRNRPIDLLVVDNYSLDIEWEKFFETVVTQIFVIDDLADRQHYCHYLLDQNYYQGGAARYQGLVPDFCQLLLGPKYLLLRDEFFNIKNWPKREGFFVNFGGSDQHDMTYKVVKELIIHFPDKSIHAVIGNQYQGRVSDLQDHHNKLKIHKSTSRISELMISAQLSIGGGGGTIFEKILMGLPSIAYAIAENQREPLQDLDKGCYIKYLGEYFEFDRNIICQVILGYFNGGLKMKVLDIRNGKNELYKLILG